MSLPTTFLCHVLKKKSIFFNKTQKTAKWTNPTWMSKNTSLNFVVPCFLPHLVVNWNYETMEFFFHFSSFYLSFLQRSQYPIYYLVSPKSVKATNISIRIINQNQIARLGIKIILLRKWVRIHSITLFMSNLVQMNMLWKAIVTITLI